MTRHKKRDRQGAFLLTCILAALLAAFAPAQPAAETAPVWANFPAIDTSGPFRPTADAWPSRWGFESNGVQGVILDRGDKVQRPQGAHRSIVRILPFDDSTDARHVSAAVPTDLPRPARVALEGPNAYVVTAAPVPPEGTPAKLRWTASANFEFISGRLIDDQLHVEHTYFSFFEPLVIPDHRPPLRGTILLMPGLFGTPPGILDSISLHFRRQGWCVLRMIAQPARFTEHAYFAFDRAGDLRAQGAQAAAVLSERAAECAYSVQAAFNHLDTLRPDLKPLPVVAVGFSGGAITLPSVLAREPARYHAAVLVGGGCHWWLINQKSNYRTMIDAVHETWIGPSPTPAEQAQVAAGYLDASPLDAFHAAVALRGKPVLMITGKTDLAVPTPTATALWERLGRPERWEVEAGHEFLFGQLPGQYGAISAWIDKALAPPASPP